jgi:thiol-disulfide isomerase/thioredoxin
MAAPEAPTLDRREPERLALLIALALGLPLLFLFGRAMTDGHRRHVETPLRAMLGNERYEALTAGEGGFPHYLGADLRAPDFTLRDRRNRPWKLSEHRGRVVVLNFWSITCPPCLEEMPTLEDLALLATRWGDVDVVAVATDSRWEDVAPAIPREPRVTYLLDPNKTVTRGSFGTRLYPETWIIDKNGVVRFRFDGQRDWSDPLTLEVINSFR